MLTLFVDPIREDLQISDTQIGLLIGTAFAICYPIFSLPLARIADGGNRRNLIFAGLLIWNLATAASAFVTSFPLMLVARVGVALGEAALLPAALSMISDLFAPAKRPMVSGLFVGVGATGGLGALMVGAAALQAVSTPFVQSLPYIGEMAGWRIVLLFLGTIGILIAILFRLVIDEPARTAVEAQTVPPLHELRAHLRVNVVTYVGYMCAFSLNSLVTLGVLTWYPAFLVRNFGLTLSEAGYSFGLIGVAATMAGGVVLPWFAATLQARGRSDGVILVAMGSVVLVAPLLAGSLLANHVVTALALAGLAVVLQYGQGIMMMGALPQLPPPRMRAQVTATMIVIANLAGLGLGPLLVGGLSDHVFGGGDGLGQALLAVICIFAPLQLGLLAWSRRSFMTTLDRAALQEASSTLHRRP